VEFIDADQHFNATPDGLVYKGAPSTLFGPDGKKVTSW